MLSRKKFKGIVASFEFYTTSSLSLVTALCFQNLDAAEKEQKYLLLT